VKSVALAIRSISAAMAWYSASMISRWAVVRCRWPPAPPALSYGSAFRR
jgi:hypothetical protein